MKINIDIASQWKLDRQDYDNVTFPALSVQRDLMGTYEDSIYRWK